MSVIIPTYNRKAYVQEAIDSALAQTYPNLEVIVVDDGSTDGTRDALRARYGDQIRTLYQENQGEAAARNRAITQSSGEYVALLDSDDIWQPEKTERQIAYLQTRPDVGLVSCHVSVIDVDGAIVSAGPLHTEQTSDRVTFESVVLNSPVHASTILVPRQCLDEVGYFDPAIRHGEDWDLCLRVARKYEVGFVAGEPLALLRTHRDAQTRYFISGSEADRRLADWEAIIHRNLDVSDRPEEDLDGLRAAALAQRRARIAMLNFVHGDFDAGRARLQLVLDLAPARWEDGARASGLLYMHALALAKEVSLEAAVRFIEGFFSHLPSEAVGWRRRYRRETLGRLYIELAFLYYGGSQYSLVPGAALTGLYYDPKSIGNFGILSIAIRSLWRLGRRWSGGIGQ